jgi:hypothetical protein
MRREFGRSSGTNLPTGRYRGNVDSRKQIMLISRVDVAARSHAPARRSAAQRRNFFRAASVAIARKAR